MFRAVADGEHAWGWRLIVLNLGLPGYDSSTLHASAEAAEWLSMHIDDRRDYLRSICNIALLPHGKGSTKVFNPDTVQVIIKAPGEGPGPLDTTEINRLKQQVENLKAEGGGTFVTFHEDGRATTYRIADTAGGQPYSESELRARMVPIESPTTTHTPRKPL